MKLVYHANPHLPRLVWYAVMSGSPVEIDVYHGEGVETFTDFFVEGAWNGDFSKGDFYKATFFMGSGGQILKDGVWHKVVIATPTHALERLYSIQDDTALHLSNSLPFILHMTGLRLDPGYLDYERDFNSLLKGLRRYERYLPLYGNRAVRLHYYCNIIIDESLALTEEDKSSPGPFADYEDYHDKLTRAIGQLIKNASSPERKIQYGLVTNISKGYDSAACAALARDFGCDTAVSFNRPGHYAWDNGAEIAKKLGYKTIILKSADEYKTNTRLVEAEFVSSGELGSDIIFSAFEQEYAGNIVFKGNLGDTFWDKNKTDINSEMRFENGVFTETCYIEYRLRTGYIALFPASFGAVEWPSIHAISNSREMSRYSIGGTYDRPIPRRILEERGIDRGMFGIHKSGAGFNYRYDSMKRIRSRMAPLSFESFYSFYKANRRKGFRVLIRWVEYLWRAKNIYIAFFLNRLGITAPYGRVRCDQTPNPGIPSYLFNWGIYVMMNRYKTAMNGGRDEVHIS